MVEPRRVLLGQAVSLPVRRRGAEALGRRSQADSRGDRFAERLMVGSRFDETAGIDSRTDRSLPVLQMVFDAALVLR